MIDTEIERKIWNSSRIEAIVSGISVFAAAVGYFLPTFREVIGWGGVVVWGVYTILYLGQIGPGRSWLGALLPACVVFLFFSWAMHR